MEQELRHAVIGDKEIDAPIAIVIGDGNTQRFRRLVEAQLVRYFREVSMAIIMVDQHRNRWKIIRVAVASVPLAMLAAP